MKESILTKYCPSCKLTKQASEFHKKATGADGLQYQCKLCINAKNSARNKLVPEGRAKNAARWKELHPLTAKLTARKSVHRYRFGLGQDPIVDAKIEELVRTNPPCVYCGTTHNITIDHKIAKAVGGSHTAEQIQPACRSCNGRKGLRSDAEFRHQLQMEAQGFKRCSKCNQFKDRLAFNKDGTTYDGNTVWCRECQHTHQQNAYLSAKKSRSMNLNS